MFDQIVHFVFESALGIVAMIIAWIGVAVAVWHHNTVVRVLASGVVLSAGLGAWTPNLLS